MWEAMRGGIATLGTADPFYVIAALALYVLSLFLVGARWRVFVRALGGHVDLGRATLANLGGIAAGNLAPATRVGGEACRIALVRQSGAVTWRQATIAAAWDRLAELPPIAVLAVMSAIALRDLIPMWRSLTVAIIALMILMVVAVGVNWLRRPQNRLRQWTRVLAADRISAATYGIGSLLATAMWIQDVLRLACATRAVGLSLSLFELAALSMLAMLGGLVPGVAGLGPVEGALMVGLISFGAPAANAVAAVAVERAISYGFSSVAGALVIGCIGGRSLWSVVSRDSMLPDAPDL
jgi:uncharacterized membrane protein YbhN (UPF0104 family)